MWDIFKPKIGLIKASLWVENILEGSDYLHKKGQKPKNERKKIPFCRIY